MYIATKCTASGCPMAAKCYRKERGNPNQIYYNYEYECQEFEGFSSFIPRIKEEVIN